jgi:hypothetical protein
MTVLKNLYGFVVNDYQKFIGGGAYMVLLFAAMYYLYRKDKQMRGFAVWIPAVVLLIFFNPVVILLIYRQFMWGTYWRILWLIPVVPILAYIGTRLITENPKWMEKGIVMAVIAAMLLTGGRVIYNDSNFQKKENYFKIPTVAIDISQHILKYSGTWYPTVIVPNELYCYIRQYTSEIRLLYGRNAEGYMGGVGSDVEAVYLEMSKQNPDCKLIGEVAYEYDVDIVIFNANFHQLPDAEQMKKYGLYYGGPVGDYIFYVLKYD